jgi:hypothetical protein
MGTGTLPGGSYIVNPVLNQNITVNALLFPPKIIAIISSKAHPEPYQPSLGVEGFAASGEEGYDIDIIGRNFFLFGVPTVRFGSKNLSLQEMLMVPVDPISQIGYGPQAYSRGNVIVPYPFDRILFSVPPGEEGLVVSVAVQTEQGQDRARNIFEYTSQA